MIVATHGPGGHVARIDLPTATSAALLGPDQAQPPMPSPTTTSTATTTAPAPATTPTATATPTGEPNPAASTDPVPTTAPTEEGPGDRVAPPAVLDTAAAIRAAAETDDWEALRNLIPTDGFTASFGQPDDPIEYYQQLQAEGTDVLGILTDLVDGPATPVPDTDL